MVARTFTRFALVASAAVTLVLAGSRSPLDRATPEGRAPTRAELVPSVEAAFRRESYAAGQTAALVVSNRARGLRLQVFRSGPERIVTRSNATMNGVRMTRPVGIGASAGRRVVRVRIGNWPSGVYFARLTAADGRVGFAPFVVRPRRLGEHRVAVVLPTLTWQAYNLRDDDGDGKGDSWYANWKHKTVRLGRPYLSRGVPYNFRRYDLPFLNWLAWTGRNVDVLAQSDLEAARSAQELASRTTSSSSPATTSTSRDGSTTSSSGSATSAATSHSSPRTTSSGVSRSGATSSRRRASGVISKGPRHR